MTLVVPVTSRVTTMTSNHTTNQLDPRTVLAQSGLWNQGKFKESGGGIWAAAIFRKLDDSVFRADIFDEANGDKRPLPDALKWVNDFTKDWRGDGLWAMVYNYKTRKVFWCTKEYGEKALEFVKKGTLPVHTAQAGPWCQRRDQIWVVPLTKGYHDDAGDPEFLYWVEGSIAVKALTIEGAVAKVKRAMSDPQHPLQTNDERIDWRDTAPEGYEYQDGTFWVDELTSDDMKPLLTPADPSTIL